jgi:hypothetical protein
LEGNCTIDEMTVLEDIMDIISYRYGPLLMHSFSLSYDITILEISRNEIYGGE